MLSCFFEPYQTFTTAVCELVFIPLWKLSVVVQCTITADVEITSKMQDFVYDMFIKTICLSTFAAGF